MNQDYIDYIKELNIGDMQFEKVWLSSQLKTTKIMTNLKHRFGNDSIDETCENAFDVLYMILSNKRYYLFETLVVIYIPQNAIKSINNKFDFSNRRITFTCCKQKSNSYYWYDLCDNEVYSLISLSNGKNLKLWETPYILEAQTDYDKDYRKEWKNGYLEYEGNEYGDTSEFYIIGCLEK